MFVTLPQLLRRGCGVLVALLPALLYVPAATQSSRLLDLARTGSPADIEQALRSGTKVDSADTGGVTALHVAAAACRPEIVTTLLNAGANKNAQARDGSTPLMFAALQGCEPVVRQLLKAGARTELFNERDETAFSLAMDRGHTDLAGSLRVGDGLTADVRATLRNSCNALIGFFDELVTRGQPPLQDERDRRIEQPSFIFGAEHPVVFLNDTDRITILFRNLVPDKLQQFLTGCAGANSRRLRQLNDGGVPVLLSPDGTELGYLHIQQFHRILDRVRQEWVVGQSTLAVNFTRPLTRNR